MLPDKTLFFFNVKFWMEDLIAPMFCAIAEKILKIYCSCMRIFNVLTCLSYLIRLEYLELGYKSGTQPQSIHLY